MFNYNHLFYFYTTAKLSGVTNAAKALKIAQPSLSSQLKTLEAELDLTLFRKVGRRLQLTPDGERVYGFCRKMFEASGELHQYLSENVTKGYRFRLGVTQEIERPFIADVLSSILKKKTIADRPHVTMITGSHQELLERLSIGELDAVFTNHQVYGTTTTLVAKLAMPVLAVMSAPLMRKLSVTKESTLSEILKTKDLGLILPTDTLKIRIETDLFLQRYKPKTPIVFESDVLAVVVRATLEGIGVAFLPKHYIFKELKQEKLVALLGGAPLWQNSIYLLTQNLKKPELILNELRYHLKDLEA